MRATLRFFCVWKAQLFDYISGRRRERYQYIAAREGVQDCRNLAYAARVEWNLHDPYDHDERLTRNPRRNPCFSRKAEAIFLVDFNLLWFSIDRNKPLC